MADIFHTFPVTASPEKVFASICTTEGLDRWWTKSSAGVAAPGSTYSLDFGPGYTWKALVTKYAEGKEFELQLKDADNDWLNTRVGFILNYRNPVTKVHFYHTGWPENNEHFKISSFCWAMYLRILKRYIENGEQVAYEQRLHV